MVEQYFFSKLFLIDLFFVNLYKNFKTAYFGKKMLMNLIILDSERIEKAIDFTVVFYFLCVSRVFPKKIFKF